MRYPVTVEIRGSNPLQVANSNLNFMRENMSAKEGMGAKLGNKIFAVAWGDDDSIYFL